jgi:hypothetical protein
VVGFENVCLNVRKLSFYVPFIFSKIHVVWDMMFLNSHRRVGLLPPTSVEETVISFETSVAIYQSTWPRFPEGLNIRQYAVGTLNLARIILSHTFIFMFY